MYRIKEMRIKCQLTQSELAEALGVHQTAVSQWESGITQPKASMLPKLLETLKCKIEDIYKEENDA